MPARPQCIGTGERSFRRCSAQRVAAGRRRRVVLRPTCVGLEVVNLRDERLGEVLGLIETPANAVLRVGDGVEKEALAALRGGGRDRSGFAGAQAARRLGSRLVMSERREPASSLTADVLTLFPEMFAALTQSGITRRALEEGRWSLDLWNPRDFTYDNHRRRR